MKKVLFIVILFSYIYMPRYIEKINHVMFVFSFIYILKENKFIQKYYLKKNIIFFNWIAVIVIIFFNVIIFFTTNNNSEVLRGNMSSFIEIPIIAGAIVLYLKKKNKNMDHLVKDIIIVAILQGIISLLCVLIPEFKKLLFETFIVTPANLSLEQLKLMKTLYSNRLNGLGLGLTYSYPAAQGLIAFLCLMYSFRVNSKYYIFILLIFFSGIVNGRITIITFFIGVIFLIFFSIFKNKTKIILPQKKIIFKIIISLIIVIFLFNLIPKNNITFRWINAGANQLIALLAGKKTGTFETLLGEDFKRLPKGFDFFFGIGKTVMGGVVHNGKQIMSDIGFVNDLWYGGIFYIALLYAFFIMNFIAVFYTIQNGKMEKKKILIIIFLVVIACHVKGTFYWVGPIWNLIVLLFVFNYIEKRGEEIKIGKNIC
ncbi:MAG: hypothetical protein ACRCSK_09105 [Fusobacteriaceae bacterium]